MVDLTKFSKEDLQKTFKEIDTYLKKTDETEFDPNQTTPDAAHLEDDLGGTSKKIEDKGGEKSVEKADFPNGDETEQMTQPSQGDAMSQILALLQEILGKLNVPAPAPPMPPAPTDQIQQSAMPPGPVATPSTTPTTEPKGDININVTKQVEEVLKGMGLTPSTITQKPKMETGHPIEKAGDLTYAKIKKMSWEELNNINAERNPGPYY